MYKPLQCFKFAHLLVITDDDMNEDKDMDLDDSKTPISVRVENGSNFFYNPR